MGMFSESAKIRGSRTESRFILSGSPDKRKIFVENSGQTKKKFPQLSKIYKQDLYFGPLYCHVKYAMSLQEQVLNLVYQRRPGWKRNELVRELKELWSCSRTAVYDRLSGRVQLNLRELDLLGRHYGIYLKDLHRTETDENAPSDPLSVLIDALTLAVKRGSTLSFATTEIPVFYLFQYPELCAVKTYIWRCFNWKADSEVVPEFNLDYWMREPENHALQQLWQLYSRVPSEEIWCSVMLDNLLNQIHYLTTAGHLHRLKDFHQIEQTLHDLLGHLREYVLSGKKDNQAALEVRDNEFSTTNNFVLLNDREHPTVYLTGIAMTVFRNDDPLLTDQLRRSWEQQVRHSQQLTNGSDRDRHLFFQKIEQRVKVSLGHTRRLLPDEPIS